MKKLILSILLVSFLGNSQVPSSTQKGYYLQKIGDSVVGQNSRPDKAFFDLYNYMIERKIKKGKVESPYWEINIDYPEIINPPIEEVDTPEVKKSFYLKPDSNGNFTKSMVETAVLSGEKNIVFDIDTLKVYYANSPHLISGQNFYLDLELLGTEVSPIILDFSKVFINCFPDKNNILKNHTVFNFRNSSNVIIKFGKVEGDKFKRELSTDAETKFEQTKLVMSGLGTKNLIVDGGSASGFMADVLASSVFGTTSIDKNASGKNYYAAANNRYESIFFNVNTELYKTFALVGGLGYNRLLKYDMEDIIFKFFDGNDKQISQIEKGKYFETYEFPEGTKKMKVNVRATDGRIESPTNFGHNLHYNPNSGTSVINMDITDNHRGGIANIGANAKVEGNRFFNTERYFSVPEFGTLAIPNTTRYHLNCEDAVSRNLIINNNEFRDKFHKILLTHNISAQITNNSFYGGQYNIAPQKLLSGEISGNIFNEGIVSGGYGTNKSQVIVKNNTGSPIVYLSNGAEWYDNNFNGGKLQKQGKAHDNNFKNTGFGDVPWTKEITNNTFIGDGGNIGYVAVGSYNYKNTFKNTSLRFDRGNHNNYAYLDGVIFDNTENATQKMLDRNSGTISVVAINSVFKGGKIHHRSVNQSVNYQQGAWYFENCTFQDISDYLFNIAINYQSTVPIKMYFKNCNFKGSGSFLTFTYGNKLTDIVFDNCTIDPLITMPANYVNGSVTMPVIIEPRTQPIPEITYVSDHTELNTDFHIMTLKIRNKNTKQIILDEDVSNVYKHYNNTPEIFEYSIDGGKYWDSINK